METSLNAHYVVALKNVRGRNHFAYLANHVYNQVSLGPYNGYLAATQRPHGYLMLDLTGNTDNGLRFRTNMFPEEYPPVVYSDIGDGACEVKLPRPSSSQDGRNEIA